MVQVTEILDRSSPKRFLGGWRDVVRDLEYHDATTQTRPVDFFLSSTTKKQQQQRRPRRSVPCQTRCEKSFTVGGIDRAVQVTVDYFPELGDRFFESAGREERRRRYDAARRIQRFYRAYRRRQRTGNNNVVTFCLAGKYATSTGGNGATGYDDINENDDEVVDDDRSCVHSGLEDSSSSLEDCQCNAGTKKTIPEIVSFYILHRFPTCNDDRGNERGLDTAELATLSNLLERWSLAEETRLRESRLDATEIIAARGKKLEHEVEVLRAIDASRSEIARKRADRARARFLDALARPVIVRGSTPNRKPIKIDTLSVQRAREFKDVYDALLTSPGDDKDQFKHDDVSERIELLQLVKNLASRHTCTASTNLENLIDQELYLLSSSRFEQERLRNLRSRVRLAFLGLARSALAHCDARDKSTTSTRLCPSCRRLRGTEAFETDDRAHVSRICIDCAALAPNRRPGLGLEIYEVMLKELRRNEATRRNGTSSLSFAVGPKAIRHLVHGIWHGRSVFSECNVLERLRLVRLDPRQPWTPWNNLLATRREARMHEVLSADTGSPPAAYDEELVRKLKRMNLQARLHFESLAGRFCCGSSTAESGMSL